MKKLNNKIFELFCAEKHSFKKNLTKPFMYDGYYCACDSCILLMADKVACSRITIQQKTEDRLPNIKSVMVPKLVEAEHTLTIQQIRAALDEIGYEDEVVTRDKEEQPDMIECPICHGDGDFKPQDIEFNGGYYELDRVECPICHGFGEIPDSVLYDPDKCDNPYDFIEEESVKTGKKVVRSNGFVLLDGNNLCRASYMGKVLQVMQAIESDIIHYAINNYRLYLVLPNIYICIQLNSIALKDNDSIIIDVCKL